ncbi:FAS1-like dehydratase domain-containing protein [Nocardia aurea]|uniref:FAS1-like dehydratase domain-containing protein n=1 Tax=Nocardia aurea TaxID=2144174 RepID=UPI001E38C1EA|nr:MaoC family dehydratase N-terminal domain-containing protein [Nocardia aurea]
MTDTTSRQSAPTGFVTERMREVVGRELDRRVSYPVAASDIRKWAVAAYYPEMPPRRFWDAPDADLVAPEDFNPFAWLVAQPPGRPLVLRDPEELLGIPGPQVDTRLRGGMAVEYGVPIRSGEAITSVRSLEGYDERDGRRGPMLFTTIADVWTNQRGEFVKNFQFTFIRY